MKSKTLSIRLVEIELNKNSGFQLMLEIDNGDSVAYIDSELFYISFDKPIPSDVTVKSISDCSTIYNIKDET